VLRKSSALGLDKTGHASASPAPELEKEPDVAALISMPGTATIVQSLVPEENLALSSTEGERDVSSSEPAKENKSGTNEPANEMLVVSQSCRPHLRVLICQKLDLLPWVR
jgi:hypothetical protein